MVSMETFRTLPVYRSHGHGGQQQNKMRSNPNESGESPLAKQTSGLPLQPIRSTESTTTSTTEESTHRSQNPTPGTSGEIKFHRSIWVGNICEKTTRDELVALFSSFPGYVDLYYMRHTRSAFVNFEWNEAVEEAALHFHGQVFRGSRLICRSRLPKNVPHYPTPVPSDSSVHVQPTDAATPVAQSPHVPIYASPPWMYIPQPAYSYPPLSMNPAASYVSNPYYPMYPSPSRSMAIMKNPVPPPPPAPPAPLGPAPINRYYILKSLSLDDLELSIRNRVWSPQLHLESLLDQAFKTSSNVYLIFSVNKSGEFFGFARMMSFVGHGRLLSWSIQEGSRKNALGGVFGLEWIMIQRLPFSQVRHLRNPWNGNKEVKVSRDGTELEPGVGHRLILEFYRFHETQVALVMQGSTPQYPLPNYMLQNNFPYMDGVSSAAS